MRNLRVPSLQHLARNWRDTPHKITDQYVRLYSNPPIISYSALFGSIHDRFVHRQPMDEIRNGLGRVKSTRQHADDLISIMDLIDGYFNSIDVRYFKTVSRRFYPVGRGILIPFDPPIIYGTSSGRNFPWFSFWRQNPLAGEPLQLFVTLVREMLQEDPELDTADFNIFDFSCASGDSPRSIEKISISTIPDLTSKRKNEMLDVFAEGFLKARCHVTSTAFQQELRARKQKDANKGQQDFEGNADGANPFGF